MPGVQRVRYVMAYDVVDDRRRGKLAQFLLDYGIRVQKSVFEAELSPREVKEILNGAANYIDSKEDNFRMYPLCGTCSMRVKELGRCGPAIAEGVCIV